MSINKKKINWRFRLCCNVLLQMPPEQIRDDITFSFAEQIEVALLIPIWALLKLFEKIDFDKRFRVKKYD